MPPTSLWLPVFAAVVGFAAGYHELYGSGLCGVTQTFARYQGRMTSVQREPGWVPTDNPKNIPYVSVDVLFEPKHFTIALQSGSDASQHVTCRFECAGSFPVPNYPLVTMIAVNASELVSGNATAFGCLDPDNMAAGETIQTTTSLMMSYCGNGTGPQRTGLNGSNYFELQFQPYYHSIVGTPESNWLQNLTFQSLAGADFDKWNVTNPAYPNMQFTNIPWMQCPCTTSCTTSPNSAAYLDVTISLRAVRSLLRACCTHAPL